MSNELEQAEARLDEAWSRLEGAFNTMKAEYLIDAVTDAAIEVGRLRALASLLDEDALRAQAGRYVGERLCGAWHTSCGCPSLGQAFADGYGEAIAALAVQEEEPSL